MQTNLAGTSVDTGDCHVGAMLILAMTWIIRWCTQSAIYEKASDLQSDA